MDALFTFFCIMIGIACFGRAVTAKLKAKADEKLLRENPAAWKQKHEFEAAQKRQSRTTLFSIVFGVFKILMKK